MYVLVLLNTLLADDTTVAAIAFGGTGAEAVNWPFGAGISTPGTKHVLTLWGTGGAWDQASLLAVGGRVAVSVADNAIEASIPLSLLNDTFKPGTRRFRAYAATGLWDSGNNCWMDTVAARTPTQPGFQNTPGYGNFTLYWEANLPRLFNVAFRPVDEEGIFRERKQSADLYQKDISQFYADIDLDARDATPPIPTGLHVRIYKSSTTITEPVSGINEGFYESSVPIPNYPATAKYHFLGAYQPYAVYLPAGYDRMQLFLHGAGGSYLTQMIMNPGGQADLGDYGEALLVGPLGRGTTGFYVDYSYLDVIEAMRDAMRVYSSISPTQTIDPDRVSATGYS
ncbi:MAG: hypothetical protein HY787_16760, partial [Deltaproteobacteria bacterium]|nr:hypothetical protein [Deltaproteobacteria bacterium]